MSTPGDLVVVVLAALVKTGRWAIARRRIFQALAVIALVTTGAALIYTPAAYFAPAALLLLDLATDRRT